AGFFQVTLPTGEQAYTRAGSFHLDRDGNIVTSNGDPIEPNIVIQRDALDISIAADGTVSYTVPGQTEATQAGIIQLAGFQNPAGLKALGGNLFVQTEASGDPVLGQPGGQDGLGALRQG